jgi:hypothetical protein
VTVTNSTSRVRYIAAGGQTTFAYPFRIFDDEDLEVYVNGLLQAGGYTVTNVGVEGGGNVVFTSGRSANDVVVIRRYLDYHQITDYPEGGNKFPAKAHEDALDRCVMIDQQLSEEIGRAVKFPMVTVYRDIDFPTPAAGQTIRWNLAGNGLENVPLNTDALGTFLQSGAGAVARSLASKVGEWVSVKDFGATGDGVTDDTAAIQAAAAVGTMLYFPAGTYQVNGTITLLANHHVVTAPGVRINQIHTSAPLFQATNVDNVRIDLGNAVLYGKGNYSAAWAAFSDSLDRGVQLRNCTRCEIHGGHFKNWASAAIAVWGGTRNLIVAPTIEGTHQYSTPLAPNNNFQFGIALIQTTAYGVIDHLRVIAPDISYTTQGIVLSREADVATGGKNRVIVAPVIHDIIGQHGLYISDGDITVTSPKVNDTGLAGVKFQVNDGFTLENIIVSDFNIANTSEAAVLFDSPVSGIIQGARVSGVARDVARGVSIGARIRNASFDVLVQRATQHSVLVQGDGHKDIDIRVTSIASGQYGVLVQPTNATGIRIWPKIRGAGTTAANTYDGVLINSATTTADIYDADIEDAGNTMRYGIFNAVAGGSVGVHGRLKITGAQSHAVRTATAFRAFPSDATLSGVLGQYQDVTMLESPHPVYVKHRTTSASATTLWQRALADETAYLVRAEIIAKLEGSAQRKGIVSTVIAYRDGAGAVIEGAADEDVAVASGGFAGVYTWDVSGNNVRLRVHSGGVANYDWTARVTVALVN